MSLNQPIWLTSKDSMLWLSIQMPFSFKCWRIKLLCLISFASIWDVNLPSLLIRKQLREKKVNLNYSYCFVDLLSTNISPGSLSLYLLLFLLNLYLAFEVNIILPEYVTVKDGITPKVLAVELSVDDRIINDGTDPVRFIFSYLASFCCQFVILSI